MALYDNILGLLKVGTLLRGDPRAAYLINEMQNERANNRAVQQVMGPEKTKEADGTVIDWNARSLPTGAFSITEGSLPSPEQAKELAASSLPVDRALLSGSLPRPPAGMGARSADSALPLPPSMRGTSASLKEEQMGDIRQRLVATGAPMFQEMAARQAFAIPKPPELLKLGANETAGYRDPETGEWTTVASNVKPEERKTANLVTLRMPDGSERSFNAASQQDAIEEAIGKGAKEVRTPPNAISLNVGGDKAVTGVDSKRYEATTGALATLDGMAPFLQRMQGAMNRGAQTGWGQDWALLGKQAAEEWLGTKIDGTSEQEVFQSIQNYLGPRMRTPGSGSSSDRDVTLFLNSIPELSKTEAGNAELIYMYEKVRDYFADVAQIQQDLLREHEYIPVKLERERLKALGPVFTDEDRQRIKGLKETAPKAGASTTTGASADTLPADTETRKYVGWSANDFPVYIENGVQYEDK